MKQRQRMTLPGGWIIERVSAGIVVSKGNKSAFAPSGSSSGCRAVLFLLGHDLLNGKTKRSTSSNRAATAKPAR